MNRPTPEPKSGFFETKFIGYASQICQLQIGSDFMKSPTRQLMVSLILIAVMGTSCTKKTTQVVAVDATEAQGLLANRFAWVVDVREGSPPELKVKGIGSSVVVHVPFSDLKAGKLDALKQATSKSSTDTTLLVVGDTTEQSIEAAQLLAQSGMKAGTLGSVPEATKSGLLAS